MPRHDKWSANLNAKHLLFMCLGVPKIILSYGIFVTNIPYDSRKAVLRCCPSVERACSCAVFLWKEAEREQEGGDSERHRDSERGTRTL